MREKVFENKRFICSIFILKRGLGQKAETSRERNRKKREETQREETEGEQHEKQVERTKDERCSEADGLDNEIDICWTPETAKRLGSGQRDEVCYISLTERVNDDDDVFWP